MKGFASTALVLLPDMDFYKESYGGYKQQFEASVHNLLGYLKSIDMEPQFLITDPLATALFLGEQGVGWLATENQGGMYFLQNNLNIPKPENLRALSQDIVEALDKKFPIERGCTFQQRGYTETKRVALAEKLLIADHKVVFLFGKQYNLRAKPEDGRALFYVNSQFIPKLKLSGYDANICAFLNFPTAHMALTEWRDFSG